MAHIVQKAHDWINVRDPLHFLGYGIPYIFEKRILFSWAKPSIDHVFCCNPSFIIGSKPLCFSHSMLPCLAVSHIDCFLLGP